MKTLEKIKEEAFLKIPKETRGEIGLLGLRGSLAHGTYIPSDNPDSIDDIDLMGIAIPNLHHYFGVKPWGSRGTKEIKVDEYDIVIYEFRKFIGLLKLQNPNVLSLLWLKDYLIEDENISLLRHYRNIFSSKHAYHSYIGYAMGQKKKMIHYNQQARDEMVLIEHEFKKRKLDIAMEVNPSKIGSKEDFIKRLFQYIHEPEKTTVSSDEIIHWYNSYREKYAAGYLGDKRKRLIEKFGWDCKNGSHAIRLLQQGIEFLKTGELIVDRTGIDAEKLIEIKTGKWTLEQVHIELDRLFKIAEEEKAISPLPEGINEDKINRLCVEILGRKFNLIYF